MNGGQWKSREERDCPIISTLAKIIAEEGVASVGVEDLFDERSKEMRRGNVVLGCRQNFSIIT